MAAHQDWEPVVLQKRTPHGAVPETSRALNRALREGKVEVVERFGAGGNKTRRPSAPPNARRLDQETEDFKHPHVTHEFKVALMRARQEKKMTQADLAKAIAVKPSVVQEYENGRAIPDPAVITKLNRALGTQLPKIPKRKRPTSESDS